jgi:regulator of RNase E activity RraB
MPTSKDIAYRMQIDLELKQQLQSHGDNEAAMHVLEHHFIAENKPSLEALAKAGRILGFGASEIIEGVSKTHDIYFCFDLLSESGTGMNEVARQSILMLALGEAYGASYDGWGTLIAK